MAFTIFFFVYILHALFSWLSSFVLCGYFGCIALCASLVDGVRGWLLDAVRTWNPSLEDEAGLVVPHETTVSWESLLDTKRDSICY